MSGEISVPFHGATIVVPKDAAVEAWLDKVLKRAPKIAASVPRIGERWPGQGGFNGGVARDENGNPYWIIVSPSDVGSFSDIEWGGRGIDVTDARSDFDGRANTRAILSLKETFPAASRCAAVTCEGHADYYLPAKRELAVAYANVKELFDQCQPSNSSFTLAYATASSLFAGR